MAVASLAKAPGFMQDVARYSRFRAALRVEDAKRTANDLLVVCTHLEKLP